MPTMFHCKLLKASEVVTLDTFYKYQQVNQLTNNHMVILEYPFLNFIVGSTYMYTVLSQNKLTSDSLERHL